MVKAIIPPTKEPEVFGRLADDFNDKYRKLITAPELLPSHVGPLSRHTHAIYTAPPAKVGFGNAFERAWDAADDIKKSGMVGVVKRMERLDEGHSPMLRWTGAFAGGMLDKFKSIAPRQRIQGVGTVIPSHWDRYGNDLLHKQHPHKQSPR
jgi:hypothetical protein